MAMNQLSARLASLDIWPGSGVSKVALAEAGFYYSNSNTADDTVICFSCEKELGGWEAGDDPLAEHLRHPSKSKPCAWAVLMNEKRNPKAPPTGAALLKAREGTFKGWPHEKKRGWNGKAKKMAKGGWVFAPTEESEDLAICIYCNLSLDGWEASDDPVEEHKKRVDQDCAFFNGLPESPAQAILEMTKNAFTTEKAQARRRASTDTKRTKRKLPVKKVMTIDEEPEDPKETELVPIILKSARKERANFTEPSSYESPVHRRTRSSSITGGINYADFLSPEEKPVRSSSRPRGKRARTPLEDISDVKTNSPIEKIEVIEEEAVSVNQDEQENRGRKRAKKAAKPRTSRSTSRTRTSAVQEPRRSSRRGSTNVSSNIEEVISRPRRTRSSTVVIEPIIEPPQVALVSDLALPSLAEEEESESHSPKKSSAVESVVVAAAKELSSSHVIPPIAEIPDLVVPELAPTQHEAKSEVQSQPKADTVISELDSTMSEVPQPQMSEDQEADLHMLDDGSDTSLSPVDYSEISIVEILDSPKPISSRWQDINSGVYERSGLPATIVRQFSDIPEAERDMTVEAWLRLYTQREVSKLEEECEIMIAKVIEGAARVRAVL